MYAAAFNSPPARLGILAFLEHALHVTVGIKLNPLSARFDGIEAAHARGRNVGDVVIALLYKLLLLRAHLRLRCGLERVIIAQFWVLSLHRPRDRQHKNGG